MYNANTSELNMSGQATRGAGASQIHRYKLKTNSPYNIGAPYPVILSFKTQILTVQLKSLNAALESFSKCEYRRNQCFCFSRNIGEVTPKIIYVNYLFSLSNKIFTVSKYPKNNLFNFEKRSAGRTSNY